MKRYTQEDLRTAADKLGRSLLASIEVPLQGKVWTRLAGGRSHRQTG